MTLEIYPHLRGHIQPRDSHFMGYGGYDIFLSWIKGSVSPPIESWNVDICFENETSPKFNSPSCLCYSIFDHHTYLLITVNSVHSYKTSILPFNKPTSIRQNIRKKKTPKYPTFPPFLGPSKLVSNRLFPPFKGRLRVKWPLLLLPPHVHSSFAPLRRPVAERYPPSARRHPNKPRPPSFYGGPWGHIFRDRKWEILGETFWGGASENLELVA